VVVLCLYTIGYSFFFFWFWVAASAGGAAGGGGGGGGAPPPHAAVNDSGDGDTRQSEIGRSASRRVVTAWWCVVRGAWCVQSGLSSSGRRQGGGEGQRWTVCHKLRPQHTRLCVGD
jgi:hypothetical protein